MATSSAEHPIYRAAIITNNNKKYDLKGITMSLNISEPKGQIAQKVSISMANCQDGSNWLSSIIKNRDRLFVYASTGGEEYEIFRGFVWDNDYQSKLQKTISLVAYDNLIYFQESEDSLFFAADMDTKSVVSEIFNKWGIDFEYSYSSITHGKLVLRGNLSDILITDLLDEVQNQTGQKYVIRSEKDKVKIMEAGTNSTVFKLVSRKNAIQTTRKRTMSGMVTQVIITGTADDDERVPIEATVSRNTDKYGTLQKIISKSEDTELSEVQKEADVMLDDGAEPIETISIDIVDNPKVRKGDKVSVSAGDLIGYFLVLGVSRSAETKTATLDLERI